MSTLAEIKAAAEALPREEQEGLLQFLSQRLHNATFSERFKRSREHFEASPGRCVVTTEDVRRAEQEEDEQRYLRR